MCQLLILTFFDGFAVLEPVSSEVLGRSHNCLPMNGRNYPQEYVAILVDLSPQANGIAVNGSWMHRRARMTSEKKGENQAKTAYLPTPIQFSRSPVARNSAMRAFSNSKLVSCRPLKRSFTWSLTSCISCRVALPASTRILSAERFAWAI